MFRLASYGFLPKCFGSHAILRSGRKKRCAFGKMQSGAAEKWGEVTKKWASRLGGSGAKEIDEADFAVVLVGDRIALAPIAQ